MGARPSREVVARARPNWRCSGTLKTLAPGFLIAMPRLGDPNFQRSVVLMIEHSDEGAMGLVLNRQAKLTLKDVGSLQKLKVARERVHTSIYVGGPVEPYRGFVLHDSETILEKVMVMPGLFLSVTSDALGVLLASPTPRLRFCLGYAGWGPKQIERELAQGSWLFTEATPGPALEGEADGLWAQTIQGMGVDPAMIISGGGMN